MKRSMDLVTFITAHAQQVGCDTIHNLGDDISRHFHPNHNDAPIACDDGELATFDHLAGIEVFYSSDGIMAEDGCYTGAGYYWWFCQPGYLPDSEACGPFETRVDAARDALDTLGE